MAGPALPQRRAGFALKLIQDYALKASEPEKAAYAKYIKSLPAAIIMNGLGQALATELAQGGKDKDKGQGGNAPKAHGQIYRHVECWLCGDDPEVPFSGRCKGQLLTAPVLMQCLCESDQNTYLLAQAEAMAFIEWLKKFANAFLTTGGTP
jgi:CRISPR-associated protein Cmr5